MALAAKFNATLTPKLKDEHDGRGAQGDSGGGGAELRVDVRRG